MVLVCNTAWITSSGTAVIRPKAVQFIKSRYQDKTDATILLESDIAYDTLVQVMDAVRAGHVV